jgi:hypothetical protein
MLNRRSLLLSRSSVASFFGRGRPEQRPRQPRPRRRRSPVTDDARPDRHALLELQALLIQIAALRGEGDADRFTADDRYRWVLHRLWIAAGNEALACTQAVGQPVRADRTWANLYDLRNHLAHSRLPDIDESLVRRCSPGRGEGQDAAEGEHVLISARKLATQRLSQSSASVPAPAAPARPGAQGRG